MREAITDEAVPFPFEERNPKSSIQSARDFYAGLLSEQQPLGEEFGEAVFRDLESLYEA
ncbi:hypothetical protein PCC82_04790 [Agrobacterium deltaense]